ncbi:hypothetical protein ABPG72_014436 [Tetrahymena utriculariae]
MIGNQQSQGIGDLSDSKFNDFAQQKQEELNKEQIKEVQDEIKNLLGKLAKMSNSSQNATTLFEQLKQLSPLFRQFGSYLHCLDDKIQHELYLKFRNVFKDFKEGVSKKVALESLNALDDPEKMKEIKDSIGKVAQDLNSLCQCVYEDSKRYLIWVDTYQSSENKDLLCELQLIYSPTLTVQFYSDVEKFKSEFQKYYNQPVFLIMSGQVANDHSYSDKKLFNYIKGLYNQNKQQVKIRGIIIYTSQKGYIHLKDKFENDDSKLVKKVTYDTDKMLQALNLLISPSKFCRVVNLDDLSYLFESALKYNLLNMHKPHLKKSLLEYNPQKINLKQIFTDAKKIIKLRKIPFYEELEFESILTQVNNIYLQNSNDQQENQQEIAKQLLRLYTKEGQNQQIQFYQLINNTLNTLNEELIKNMIPFIEMLQIALYTYDDSLSCTSIKKGKTQQLFRGSSITQMNYQNIIKLNQFICLPSFSSFTSKESIAIDFMLNNLYPESRACLFIYEHQTGSQQYDFRPKSLKEISEKKYEYEFLTYPFVTYRIIDIKDLQFQEISYSQITLTLN